ncbi:MAG: hypothetical protein ACYC05_15305 [Sulfuricella sp.]
MENTILLMDDRPVMMSLLWVSVSLVGEKPAGLAGRKSGGQARTPALALPVINTAQ